MFQFCHLPARRVNPFGRFEDCVESDDYSGVDVELLEPRILLTGLPVDWVHLSSADGDLPVPESNIGQSAVLVVDIDGDGLNDYVVTSWQSAAPVAWFRYDQGQWTQYVIDRDRQNLEAGGTFHDIDNDGDQDIVFGGAYDDHHIYWWENPGSDYDPAVTWVRREIKNSGDDMHHDMGFADVDGDGDDEFISFNQEAGELLLFEVPADPKAVGTWSSTVIYSWIGGIEQEGMVFTDVNLDGKEDIVATGRWFEHVDGSQFVAHVINDSMVYPRMTAGQLVTGGRPEIVMVAGDSFGTLIWYEWNGIDWTQHVLDAAIEHGHTLQVGDVNQDGHLDIVVGEMGKWTSDAGEVYNPDARIRVFYGDSQGNFIIQSVSVGQGIHEGKLDDLDGDGDLDILGKPFRDGIPRIDMWINEGNLLSLDNWMRYEIDSDLPWRPVLVEHGDLDGDGLEDAVTGGWWYRNPGSPDGVWQRNAIGLPLMSMGTVYDFDQDGDLDILGTQNDASLWHDHPGFNGKMAWAENDGAGNFTIHENIDEGIVTAFLQGIIVDRFGPNGTGPLEVAIAWELLGGTYSYVVGEDPAADTWQQRLISPVSLGEEGIEELDSADIDGDGDQDILLGTKWLRNDISEVDNWWHADWDYRAPIMVDVNGYDRTDKPVQLDIDFTALLAATGESGPLDVQSIRVIEVDSAGQALDTNVAFQFDPSSDFDAANNATGTLVLVMAGLTPAGTSRQYQVYYDIEGKGFNTAQVTPMVSVTDGVIDEGQESIQIDTLIGSYLYQKQGGGFSSLLDINGNDWISHHPTGGSDGQYRGIPNLAYPEGYLHPGDTSAITTIVSTGPVKATIHSVTTDGQWEAVWEIYPTCATMTVLNAAHDYWFLYEGTPGGSLEVDQDFVVRSDGTATYASQSWEADLPGDDWVYFADPVVGRSLFAVNHDADSATASYSAMNDEMTVFGFGRSGTEASIDTLPARFTIGLMDQTVYSAAEPIIAGASQAIVATLMPAETASAVPQSNAWTPFTLFTTTEPTDRSRLADINQDGLLDVVITYSIHNDIGRFAWYEQPASSPTDPWIEHNIAYIDFPHSLDIADMDGDGDLDIVTGEHRVDDIENARTLVYENLDGVGGQWLEHEVYTGDEHHLGTQLFDADNDGDLDIISVGWFNDKLVIYENRAIVLGQVAASTPVITPDGGGYQGAVVVSISTQDANGDIYYTLDGSEPTNQSLLYNGPFTLTQSSVVRAVNYVSNLQPSDVAQVSLTVFTGATARVTDGLQVIYEFNEGGGDLVTDSSTSGDPLNLTIADVDHVTWGDGLLTIDAATMIFSDQPAGQLIDAVMASNEVTIEAWVSTSDLDQNGPARIATLSQGSLSRNFTLGQGVWSESGDRLAVRLRTTQTDLNGSNPSIASPEQSLSTEMTHVVYTFSSSTGLATLYMDNQVVASEMIGGNMSNWDAASRFALGNEFDADRPWLGTFDLVAVYGRALTAVEVAQNYYATDDTLFGDVNLDGLVDAADIDRVFAYFGNAAGDPACDLDGSGEVDQADVDLLVRDILNTEYGDANLDGMVNLVDLDILGEYFATQQSVGWAETDFNGNGSIGLVDLDILGRYFGTQTAMVSDEQPLLYSSRSPSMETASTPDENTASLWWSINESSSTSGPFDALPNLADMDEDQEPVVVLF